MLGLGLENTMEKTIEKKRQAKPSEKGVLYFAYGSNLDFAQMSRRCPDSILDNRAVLNGYQIIFGGHSFSWGGAVASVKKTPRNKVHGLLYRLSKNDLKNLDGFEGHPIVYKRRRLSVVDEFGKKRYAQVYILPVEKERFPSAQYLGVISRAYGRHGFDRKPLTAAIRGVL